MFGVSLMKGKVLTLTSERQRKKRDTKERKKKRGNLECEREIEREYYKKFTTDINRHWSA